MSKLTVIFVQKNSTPQGVFFNINYRQFFRQLPSILKEIFDN